jgi:hypothetical protein
VDLPIRVFESPWRATDLSSEKSVEASLRLARDGSFFDGMVIVYFR